MIGAHTGLPWPAIYHRRGGGGPPPPYHADAVHFDGSQTLVSSAVLSIADSPTGFYSFWTKGQWSGTLNNDYLMFHGDATNPRATLFYPGVVRFGNDVDAQYGYNYDLPTDDVWVNVIQAWDMNHPAGEKLYALYFGGVKQTPTGSSDADSAFSINWLNNNLSIFASAQDTPSTIGDVSDWQMWMGQSIIQADSSILPGDLANFISGGKPVNPSVALAAYGAPQLKFSGNATGFAVNQGNGGAFTLTGVLTNASSSPSD